MEIKTQTRINAEDKKGLVVIVSLTKSGGTMLVLSVDT